MRIDARGVTSVDFAAAGLDDKCLLDPSTHANGPMTGNNVIKFPGVGHKARVVLYTGEVASSGVLNATLQHSDNGSDWTNVYSFPQQGAATRQVWEGTVEKPYMQLTGNIGGTSSTIECAGVVLF